MVRTLPFLIKLSIAAIALGLIVVLPFWFFGDGVTMATRALLMDALRPSIIVAVVLLLLILDIALPIPSSLVCVSAFALLPAPVAILTVTSGLTAAYVVGHLVGRTVGATLFATYFDATEISRLSKATGSTRYLAIALSRPLPVLAEATAIYLGSIGTPLLPATLCAALASTGLAAMYGWVAHAAHAQESLWMALLASMVLPGLFWAGSRALRASQSKRL